MHAQTVKHTSTAANKRNSSFKLFFFSLFSNAAKVEAERNANNVASDESSNEVDVVGPAYNKNEVNAKFRITSEHWTDELYDETSEDYKKLSETITLGVMDMLHDQGLTEQADFNVTIIGFK